MEDNELKELHIEKAATSVNYLAHHLTEAFCDITIVTSDEIIERLIGQIITQEDAIELKRYFVRENLTQTL